MRRAGLGLTVSLGTLALSAAAFAQGAPTQLTPPTRLVPPPSTAAPVKPSAPATPSDAPRGARGLQVEPLQALSNESFGTLDGDAGLGLDLWRGTRRAQMVELLSVLPGATRSYTMNALARRTLLTTATMPPADPGARGPNLLTLRSQRLAALGDYEDVSKLIAAAPRRIEDEGLLRLSVEGNLLGGDNAAACKQVRDAGGDFPDVFWRKVTIFCQAVVGETSQANLGAALMREQNPKGEVTFRTLLRAMQGDKQAKVTKLPSPTPLDIAMLNAAKLPIPDDALDTHDAGMLAAFARNAGLPLEKRVVVAERAESLGTLPTSELAQIYGATKFTPAQLSNALGESDKLGGARGRALLYVAQARQSNPAARAELLRQAFVSARAAGLYPTALRLYASALKEIPATDDLGWFAGEAARANFALNQPVDARAWLSAGRTFRPAAGAEGLSADVVSFPYELIASEKPIAWDPNRFQRWKQAQGDAAPLKTTLLLALLEGLDRAAPDEAWDGLARVQIDPAANLPSPAVLRRLEVASATERRGAAVLATLITFGDEGPAGCHPIVVGMAIAGMRYIGLQTEARGLALDAIVGNGF
jgi:hypothetical protein